LGQPFEAVDDDQRTRNDYTVSRTAGGSAHYADTTGNLGTLKVGVYDSSLTVNRETTDLLDHYASWLVHLGTLDGAPDPTLNLDFVANPSQIATWLAATLALPLGFRVDVTNLSSKAIQHPTGTVSLIVEGYSMALDLATWTLTVNCSPYAPWRIATADDT